MASKYYYYVTWNDKEPGPGVFPIDEDGKYLFPDDAADLIGQNLKLAREFRGDWPLGRTILRFNRKTHEFVGVVK